MIYVAVSVLWLASSTLAELAGGLRTNLAGEKKRDFGFDDLTTLLCSECLVEWLGGHASRKTQRKDSNDSPHVCFHHSYLRAGTAFGVHEVLMESGPQSFRISSRISPSNPSGKIPSGNIS